MWAAETYAAWPALGSPPTTIVSEAPAPSIPADSWCFLSPSKTPPAASLSPPFPSRRVCCCSCRYWRRGCGAERKKILSQRELFLDWHVLLIKIEFVKATSSGNGGCPAES